MSNTNYKWFFLIQRTNRCSTQMFSVQFTVFDFLAVNDIK